MLTLVLSVKWTRTTHSVADTFDGRLFDHQPDPSMSRLEQRREDRAQEARRIEAARMPRWPLSYGPSGLGARGDG